MRSMLQALQEGRLIELPEDKNKDRALMLLSNLIEAVTSIRPGTDVAGAVMARERVGSTVLGKGWACPHGRIVDEGDLLCAVGWSPVGLDYAVADDMPVRIVTLYLVPSNQKTAYLKEISCIARAIQSQTGDNRWERMSSLSQVREALLDMVSIGLESGGPEARARMIQLEVRQAAAEAARRPDALGDLNIQTVTIVAGPGIKPTALTQHPELIGIIEGIPDIAGLLTRNGVVEAQGWRILSRAMTNYQGERALFDCLAIRPSSAPGR